MSAFDVMQACMCMSAEVHMDEGCVSRACRYATAWKKQGYGFEFQPLVLQCGFWPSFFNLPQVNIPRPMQPAIEHFKTFYTNKHKHRSVRMLR